MAATAWTSSTSSSYHVLRGAWMISTTSSGASSSLTIDAAPRIPDQIHRGEACSIRLPDGSVLHVAKSGNWHIDDTDAQTLYRGSAELDFNRFLNASDILEDFIKFVGGLGIKRRELMALPVSAFIQFLIVRAAQEDGEEAGMEAVVALLPSAPKRKRCACCGRFIRASSRQMFCSADHAAQAARRSFERETLNG